MIATIWLILLSILAFTFRKSAKAQASLKKMNSFLILLLSKIIWWAAILSLIYMWAPKEYFNYILMASGVIFLIKMIIDKKIFKKEKFEIK